MRFLAFEFLHCDADIAAALPASMKREGETMLLALLNDLSRIDGASVDILVDPAITEYSQFLRRIPDSTTVLEAETQRLVSRLDSISADYDVVVPIAPESSGILLTVAEAIRSAGGKALLPTEDFIRRTGNKWRTYLKLREAGIDTVETHFLQDVDAARRWAQLASDEGCIVKPTDGCGSDGIWRVPDADTLARLQSDLQDSGVRRWLVQPLVPAMHFSVAVLCGPWRPDDKAAAVDQSSAHFEVLPVSEQMFEPGSAFAYRGGRIPAQISDEVEELIGSTAVSVCRELGAGTGYVGIDLLLPDDQSQPLMVIDVNPRLTTSYVGYQTMCKDNLTARQLGLDDSQQPLRWKPGMTFLADGTVLRESAVV